MEVRRLLAIRFLKEDNVNGRLYQNGWPRAWHTQQLKICLQSSAKWRTDVADTTGIRARSAQQTSLQPSTYHIRLECCTCHSYRARCCGSSCRRLVGRKERSLVCDQIHLLISWLNKFSNTNIVAESTSSSIPNSTTTNCTSPATNSTTSILATSDCDKINKIYISTIDTHTEFNVFCESDMTTGTYLGVFVYTFEDCIEGCASFNDFQPDRGGNLTCHGVSFITDYYRNPENLRGNCFLKMEGNNPLIYRANASAATRIPS